MALAALVAGCAGALAQDAAKYPEQMVRLVVPFSAGSMTDLLARTVAEKLGERWKQQVIVENRPGLAGTSSVAKATPDGYTLMLTSNGHTVIGSLNKNLSFDPIKDFAGVSQIATTPLILVGPPESDVKSVKDLVDAAKAKPGALNYGSAGVGGLIQFATEMYNRMAKIETVHVPFKGGTPAVAALMGDQIQMLMMPMLDVLPQTKAGRLRSLAVSSAKRSPFLPDIPTIAESGVPGFAVSQWWGLFAPGGLPQPITLRLNQEVGKVLQSQMMRDRLAADGAVPVHNTPEALAKLVRDEIETWRRIAREAGIKPE
jgi:tripartite-type tricarboxylate transporter receptor subunit TctC